MELTGAAPAPTEEEIRAFERDDRWSVMGFASDYTVTRWSRGSWALWGWTREEAIGNRGMDLLNKPGTAQGRARIEELRRILLDVGEHHSGAGDVWYGKDGRVVILEDAHSWRLDDGSFLSIVRGREVDLQGIAEENERLRALLRAQLRTSESLEFESGVNERLEGFVAMRWGSMAGQLTTDEACRHGIRMYRIASAAASDALLLRSLGEMGMDGVAVELLEAIRRRRDGEGDE